MVCYKLSLSGGKGGGEVKNKVDLKGIKKPILHSLPNPGLLGGWCGTDWYHYIILIEGILGRC